MRRLLAGLAVLLMAAGPFDDLAWVQRPGAAVPMTVPLVGADGVATTLRREADGRPLLLVPAFFGCTVLCGVVRQDLAEALRQSGLAAGRDYQVVVLSLDPAETPEEARRAVQEGWPALTGPAGSVQAIGDAVGFRSRFEAAEKQFIHPAGLAVVTPGGVVSGYLLGVGYEPDAVRAAVERAQAGGTARANPILLLCFHFDAVTGQYTWAVERTLKLAAVLTMAAIGFGVWRLQLRRAPGP